MSNQSLEPRGVAAAWPLQLTSQQLVPAGNEPGGYGAPAPSTELNLATLYQIFWEWRWLILSAVVAGLGIATVAALLTTPVYRSSALVEISPPTVSVMGADQQAEEPIRADNAFMETQIGLFRSRALAERVAQDLNLASSEAMVGDADLPRSARQQIVRGQLSANLKVEPQQFSRLIRVSYSSPDPTVAARVVNGFVDGFISTSLERRYQSSSYARDFLQRQIGNVRRDLESSERQLVAYAQRQGIINTGAAQGAAGTNDVGSLAGASLVDLNRALSEAQAKRILAEQQYRESQSAGPTAEAGERTSQLRAELAKVQADYEDKLTVFKADYPEVVRLRARISTLERAIATETSNVRSGRSGTLRAEYEAAAAAEGALRNRVAQLRGTVLDLRGRSIQYNILQRDVDTNRALYDALLQRYKEIGVAGGVGVSYASIVDRGSVPSGPYSPRLFVNLLVGLALGLAVGLGVALVLEFVSDTIKTPDDVRNRLRLTFLGGIPALKAGRRPQEELLDPTSPITEAFFSTGTSLSYTTEEGPPRTILVTSTRPAEGKSTTTWALAQYFARLDKRVLVIDADLRRPAFLTGHEKEDGLSSLLTTREPVAPHAVQTSIDNLMLLPCGPIPPNPAELLASPRMQVIIDEAAELFDIVIVDGPPVLGLADSPLLSTRVRGTIMVVEAGKTRTRAAVEALNRMRAAGAIMVGCILMRYRHEATGYGYGYDAYSYKSVESRARTIRAIGTRDRAVEEPA